MNRRRLFFRELRYISYSILFCLPKSLQTYSLNNRITVHNRNKIIKRYTTLVMKLYTNITLFNLFNSFTELHKLINFMKLKLINFASCAIAYCC